ncbi:MAG: 2-dehydropantoate 2-reductase PanE [Idiomarinaceae bacterium HL-53]|nr:MAG: 2-dehydropantoate 2-reductase PanE [Idiomarinaceae bacterium HL-53]CUS49471.1 2-dehydropantoate 2-reductase [Idiomarinaceae bacterium HL-53]
MSARLLQQGQALHQLSRPYQNPNPQLTVMGYTQFRGTVSQLQDPTKIPSGANWIIPVKAWQLASVLSTYSDAIHTAKEIYISHNGMGAAESELELLRHIPCFDWITTHGAWTNTAGIVHHSGHGESWVGPRFPEHQRSASVDILATALPPLNWDANIQRRRWIKLAINCSINAIATLADKENGALEEKPFQLQIVQVCNEVAQVYRQLHTDELPAETLVHAVNTVIKQTRNNRNSMLQDIHAGRPTEIDFLNGYIEKKGQKHQLPTPLNSELADKIRILSNRVK